MFRVAAEDTSWAEVFINRDISTATGPMTEDCVIIIFSEFIGPWSITRSQHPSLVLTTFA
jgi:hypothetical protein